VLTVDLICSVLTLGECNGPYLLRIPFYQLRRLQRFPELIGIFLVQYSALATQRSLGACVIVLRCGPAFIRLTSRDRLTHTLDRLTHWLTAEWRSYWYWLTRWLRKMDWLAHWTGWLIDWLLNDVVTDVDWLADFARWTDSHTGQVDSLTDCWMTFILILIDSLTSQNGLTHALDRLVYWLTARLQNNAMFRLFLNENIVSQYAKGPVLIPTIHINLENTTSKIMCPQYYHDGSDLNSGVESSSETSCIDV
jgi:hypothetical protein